jgi:hypothetical protein
LAHTISNKRQCRASGFVLVRIVPLRCGCTERLVYGYSKQ